MWAYNNMDPTTFPGFHTNRGALPLVLNDGQEPDLLGNTQSVPLPRNKCASNCPPTWYSLPNGRCIKIVTFGYDVTANDGGICADYTLGTNVARLFIPQSDDDLQFGLTVFPWATAYAIGWNYVGSVLSDSEGNAVDLTHYTSLTSGISGSDECIYIDNNEVINSCTNSIGYICEVKSCGCH
ncbi:uncharacterized protein LOC117105731 [Anneissia japonica]|uniref:uncharacterized protein LOC117105731 n=1 Tax=Anneissia japonica TaxID=1529436 RepID=UPI0014256CA0|nr:uncharacterized protein LOC117105731 [Anneissia japonica]